MYDKYFENHCLNLNGIVTLPSARKHSRRIRTARLPTILPLYPMSWGTHTRPEYTHIPRTYLSPWEGPGTRDTSENITFPQLLLSLIVPYKIIHFLASYSKNIEHVVSEVHGCAGSGILFSILNICPNICVQICQVDDSWHPSNLCTFHPKDDPCK